MRRHTGVILAVSSLIISAACDGRDPRRAEFSATPGMMAVLSATVADSCPSPPPRRVSVWSIWIDGARSHEVLLFPGAGPPRYDSLLGPFGDGRHSVELRPSEFWAPADCVTLQRVEVKAVDAGAPAFAMYRHAPVLELRADTIGEESDLPLYAYAERVEGNGGAGWRYTVVFSNEDGGTPTRALLARWGRTTDIEQVYEVTASPGGVVREEFQGPDHATRSFTGRRQGEAPVLLVATLNNMVLDRGRSLAAVRLVPSVVDLSEATRESTMDERPWVYRVMERELAAEGRIAADAPVDEQWPRVAPNPASHVYVEARLRLDRTLAVAWAADRAGRRFWSHYGKLPLAIDRDGWVRSAVALGPDPLGSITEIGWACLPAPDAERRGSCEIDASRAFVLTGAYRPGADLILPGRLVLRAGEEGVLDRVAIGGR